MDFDSVALDLDGMPGPLEARLAAVVQGGFRRVVLSAADLAGHPQGAQAAVRAVQAAGVKVLALRELRDFEGHEPPLQGYKDQVARGLLQLARDVRAEVLLVHAGFAAGDAAAQARAVRDLARLAILAVPMGIRIGYQPHPDASLATGVMAAEDVVNRVERANFGLAIDTDLLLTQDDGLDALEQCYLDRLALVQLSDPVPSVQPGAGWRLFPGEGGQGAAVAALVRHLRQVGGEAGYSLRAAGPDDALLPAELMVARARAALERLVAALGHVGLPPRR